MNVPNLLPAIPVFKVTQTTTVSEATAEYIREGHVHILQHKEIPAYVSIFRIHGPFLFGSTDKIDVIVNRVPAMRMREAEFHEHVGEENICRSVAEALDRAKTLHPEVAKQLPAGSAWGRRSTDASMATRAVVASSDEES